MSEKIKTKKSCYVYIRSSSKNKEIRNQQFQKQLDKCAALAKKHNWEIKQVFTENKPALRMGLRPVFDRMLDKMKEDQGDYLISSDLARLSRNPEELRKLDQLREMGVLKNIVTGGKKQLPDFNPLPLGYKKEVRGVVMPGMYAEYKRQRRKSVTARKRSQEI